MKYIVIIVNGTLITHFGGKLITIFVPPLYNVRSFFGEDQNWIIKKTIIKMSVIKEAITMTTKTPSSFKSKIKEVATYAVLLGFGRSAGFGAKKA